jgi:hypothetical protein
MGVEGERRSCGLPLLEKAAGRPARLSPASGKMLYLKILMAAVIDLEQS